MKRLFAKNKCSADSVLSASEFKFTCDGEPLGEIPKDKGECAVRHAEKYLEGVIPVLPASDFMRFVRDGNRMIFERPYHDRRKALVFMSLAEAYERMGRFTDRIIDYLFAVFEESTWVIPAHQSNIRNVTDGLLPPIAGDGALHGIDLFAATTAATLTTVYLCVGDELDKVSPVIIKRLRYEIEKRIFIPYSQITFGWSGEFGGAPSNWNPWIISNVLYTAAILEEDMDRRRAIVSRSMRYLDNYTAFLGDDGGCDEGPSYWSSAAASYFDAAEILYGMSGGKIDIFKEPLLRDMCEYEVKLYVDGITFLNFADCPPHIRLCSSMLNRMGKRLSSPALKSFSHVMARHHRAPIENSHGYRVYRGFFDFVEPTDESEGITDAYLPDLKIMVARENPKTDTGMLVAVKGGDNGEHHNHNDLGSVSLYYGGKPVFMDNGAGEYTKKTFSSERYTLWYMQSRYHNTLTVNGVAQTDGRQFRTTDEVYDRDARSLTLQLREAYGSEAGIKSLKRTVGLNGGTVTITDEVSLCEMSEVEIHFLTPEAPTFRGNRALVAQGRVLTFDERLTPSVEKIELDPSLVGRWGTPEIYMIRLKATVKEATFVLTVE